MVVMGKQIGSVSREMETVFYEHKKEEEEEEILKLTSIWEKTSNERKSQLGFTADEEAEGKVCEFGHKSMEIIQSDKNQRRNIWRTKTKKT